MVLQCIFDNKGSNASNTAQICPTPPLRHRYHPPNSIPLLSLCILECAGSTTRVSHVPPMASTLPPANFGCKMGDHLADL